MTATDFLDALAATGTGAHKLRPAREYVAAHPDAAAGAAFAVLARTEGVSEVTAEKALKLLGSEAPPAKGDLPPFPVRAPAGGVTVGGKTYAGGERVPGPAVDAATADEIRALLGDESAAAAMQSPPEAEKSAAPASAKPPKK